jgi:hypothetical protein
MVVLVVLVVIGGAGIHAVVARWFVRLSWVWVFGDVFLIDGS